MTQNATVIAVRQDGRAEIAVKRASACGENCASCGAHCENRDIYAVAENKLGAHEGDSVIVESSTSKVIGIALIVYIVPLVFFALGYAICAIIGLKEGICIAASIAAMLIGTLAARFLNNSVIKRKDFAYNIIRVISS